MPTETIKNGYCIIVRNFYAAVVPFATVGVEFGYKTVPVYTVELPNGEEEEFNETELKYSKEELEKRCRELNEKMKDDREFWHTKGLPALHRYELENMASGSFN